MGRTPYTLTFFEQINSPQGPWLTTADEIPDPRALRIRTWVDDELRQDGSTAELVYGPDELLAWCSRGITLEPGDRVADGQHLVDEQDLGVDVDRDREAQPDVHARRVVPHRRVDELLEPGERHDVVEHAIDVGLLHAEDRRVEVHVFASRQIGVEAGAQLEQGGEPARVLVEAHPCPRVRAGR